MAVSYGLLDPYFAYPVSALLLGVLWGSLSWSGWVSGLVILAIITAIVVAAGVRALRGLEVVAIRPRSERMTLVIMLGGSALWLVIAFLVALFL